MTTNERPRITPDDVEFVSYADIAIGDVIVKFTPVGRSVAIAPTQRQLNLARTTYTTVRTIVKDRINNCPVVDLNQDDAPNRITALIEARTWRIKRGA